MRLLMISTDKGLLDPSSRVTERFRGYASLFETLDVVVCCVGQYEPLQVTPTVTIHPTNSTTKLRYFADAVRIGSGIRADVVSGQDPFEIGLIAYRIASRLGVALHLQVHTDMCSDAFIKHSLLNRIRIHVARWLLPKAAGVRVVSERIASSLSRIIPSLRVTPVVLPIIVQVPSSVTPTVFSFAQTVLMVSRLEPEKQIAQAIEGFVRVHATRPDVGLVIIGDGSQRHALEALVAQHNAQEYIVFAGAQSNVFDAYAGADVFLQVSAYEGYGMTLLEAALSGLPIVTTDVGVVGEVLVDGGSCLVTSGTPQDIATKLGVLLDEESFRMTIGGRAREAAQAHVMTPQAYADAYKRAFTIQ